MKESTSPVIALQGILHYNQKFPTYFMKEGLEKEPEIISKYIAERQEDSHQVTVKKKWIHRKCNPWVFGSKSRRFSP